MVKLMISRGDRQVKCWIHCPLLEDPIAKEVKSADLQGKPARIRKPATKINKGPRAQSLKQSYSKRTS